MCSLNEIGTNWILTKAKKGSTFLKSLHVSGSKGNSDSVVSSFVVSLLGLLCVRHVREELFVTMEGETGREKMFQMNPEKKMQSNIPMTCRVVNTGVVADLYMPQKIGSYADCNSTVRLKTVSTIALIHTYVRLYTEVVFAKKSRRVVSLGKKFVPFFAIISGTVVRSLVHMPRSSKTTGQVAAGKSAEQAAQKTNTKVNKKAPAKKVAVKKALQAKKALQKGAVQKKRSTVRTSVHFHRPKTLKLRRTPRYPRNSVPKKAALNQVCCSTKTFVYAAVHHC
jgi:hypothetical protein